MLRLVLAFWLFPFALCSASEWVLIRTIDGTQVEGQTSLRGVQISAGGRTSTIPLTRLLSAHSGAPASEQEAGLITNDLAAIQSTDRNARDAAVEELTAIGVPVLTPLLRAYKDTDQHEPRPLYRLFERIMPSYADGPDRTLGLIRLAGGETVRGSLAEASIDLRTADGGKTLIPVSKVRALAVRRPSVRRAMQVHSLRHSTRIEDLDTGVSLSASSKVDISTRGFVRLSWDTDSWATDADGLQKPGSPAYKTNLVDGFPFGALVGRVGAAGPMFFVGAKATLTGKPAGRLRLAVNDNAHWQNNVGTYSVTLVATDAYDMGDAQ